MDNKKETQNNNKWLKKYCIIGISLLIILLIFLPLIINLCYKWETEYEILQYPSSWAIFWATYLAAIASFAMVFVTWLTLKQNKNQLNELKRQWEEEHRPKVLIYLTKGGISETVDVEILNIGKTPAENIQFYLDCILFDDFSSKIVKEKLKKVGNSRPSFLLPNESLTFSLYKKEYECFGNKYHDKYYIANEIVDKKEFERFIKAISSAEIKVTGKYNNKYIINDSICINNIRNSYLSINKSLDKINNTLININYNLKNNQI